MTRPQRRWLSALLVVALLVRVAWAVAQPRTPAAVDRLPDQREYLTLADGLLHHGSLRLDDARFGQTVVAYRLPGYPMLVAACDGSVLAVRLVQAAVDASTVLAVFLLARRLTGDAAVGLTAAAALAVDPLFVYFSGLVLTETAFAAALAWATVAAARRSTAATAALFVVAVYLRPTALVLAPPVVWLAMNGDGRRPYHWTGPLCVTLLVPLALVPWAGRNLIRLGTPVWTTTNDGITFYDGFHDGATGASDQRFLAGWPALRSMTEVGRSRELSRLARRWVWEHPAALPALALRKAARGWSPVPLSRDFGRPLYRWAGGAYAVPFDLLCLAGLASRRLRVSAKLLLLAPAVVLTAVQVMTVGSIRYRMPAEAELAVLAGLGATDVWRTMAKWPRTDVRGSDRPLAPAGPD